MSSPNGPSTFSKSVLLDKVVPPFCSYNSISSTLFQIFVLFCSSTSKSKYLTELYQLRNVNDHYCFQNVYGKDNYISNDTEPLQQSDHHQQLGSDQMFCSMSHNKVVLTEALIHLKASASGTNENDIVVRYMWRHIFLWQKTWVTMPASSKSWISRWFRTLLASIVLWMRPHLDIFSLEPGQLFTFPSTKTSFFSAAMTFKSIFKPRIIFVPCNLTEPMLTRKAFYSLQCVLYVACRNVSNICNRANANMVSLLHQCKVWGAYPICDL